MPRKIAHTRLHAEPLEDRSVPTTVTWDGGGNDFDWNTAANWSGDVLPGPSDDVEIDFGGNAFTVTHSSGTTAVHSLTSKADLLVSGGELLTTADSQLFGALTLNTASIGGSGDITVSGLFTWVNGNLRGAGGAGSLTANGGTALIASGNYYPQLEDGFRFINPTGQTVTWTGFRNVRLFNQSVFENDGTLDVQTNAGIQTDDTATTFINTGTVVKSGAAVGFSNFSAGAITNSGLIHINVGGAGLESSTTTTNTGTIRGMAGTTLAFNRNLISSGVIDGDQIEFYSGVAAVTGSLAANSTYVHNPSRVTLSGSVGKLGAVILVGSLDLTNATLAPAAKVLSSLWMDLSGTLVTDDNLSVSGLFTWVNGNLRGAGGAGSLTANGGTALIASGNYYPQLEDGFRFINPTGQTATWTGFRNVRLFNQSVFENQGTIDIQNSAGIQTDDTATTFINTGTVVKSGAAVGFSNFSAGAITNSGLININVGGAGLESSTTTTNTGTIRGLAETTLAITGNLNSSGVIDGDQIEFNSGVAAVTGSFAANSTYVHNPSRVTLSGTVGKLGAVIVIGSLDLTNATLAPAATVLSSLWMDLSGTLVTDDNLSVSGLFTWVNGNLRGAGGAGSLTANGGTALIASGNYYPQLEDGFRFINPTGQTATWTGFRNVRLFNQSVFENDGTLDVQTNAGIQTDDTATAFINTGTVVKSGAAVGFSNFSAGAITNSGLININLGGAGLESSTTTTNTGTIRGMAGTTLAIAGNVSLSPTSVTQGDTIEISGGWLRMQISGPNPGIGYDQITATGQISLRSSLQLELVGGFSPTLNGEFTLIQNQSTYPISGTFSGLPEGSEITDNRGNKYRISYLAARSGDDIGNDVVLTTTFVSNSPPIAHAGGPYSVAEGGSLVLNGSGNDPDNDPLTYAWDFNNDGQFDDATGKSPTISAASLDGYTGAFVTVRLRVTDTGGLVAFDTATINIANVAPTATITGPASGQQGQALAFSATGVDPGLADNAAGFTYYRQVTRDSSPVNLIGITTSSLFSFVPDEVGTYTLTLTVTDKDGGTTTVTHSVAVSATPGVTLNNGVLVIIGTSENDDIKVNPGGGAPEIKVIFNGSQSTWLNVTRIVVYANAGNDRVQIAGGITLPVTVFGGSGDDSIKAGGGPSVLVGGDGNDTLLGGSGRDILIGGTGADLIGGNDESDLLIAGFTAFDANLAALDLIQAEWTSSRSFADRVANLSGTGTTGVNGTAVIRSTGANRTVFEDNAVDRLTGDAGNDWFVFNSIGGVYVDKVTDLSAFEGQFDMDL